MEWLKNLFRAKKRPSPVPDMAPLWHELGALLKWAYHDGWFDESKPVWEQDIPEFKLLWERITSPAYVEAIQAERGKGGNSEWDAMLEEAYRQSLARRSRR
jgi:hypothetical protein